MASSESDMASSESDDDKYHRDEMECEEPTGHYQDSSLDSHKKKEVVTGESEMKPRIGVLNQDQGISLDIPSNEESDSDKELESLGKKIEEDKKRYQLMLKKKEAKKHQSDLKLEDDSLEEIRIVLVGHIGNGKSSTGNTILGQTDYFKSSIGGSSRTEECGMGVSIRDDKRIIVIDTPGLKQTDLNTEDTLKEIRKCVGVCLPGPHAILFVLKIRKRFTREEEQSVTQLEKLFNGTFYEFLIVIFTGKDLLKNDETLAQQSNKMPASLQRILIKANNRTIAFNNYNANFIENKTQVDELFATIDEMGKNKKPSYYTDSNLDKLEKAIKKKRNKHTMTEIRGEILNEGESFFIVNRFCC